MKNDVERNLKREKNDLVKKSLLKKFALVSFSMYLNNPTSYLPF